MNSEDTQLRLLTDELEPTSWPCPNCHGERRALRLLYPDERVEGGPFTEWGPCRTCQATGTIDYDPTDLRIFPYGGVT